MSDEGKAVGDHLSAAEVIDRVVAPGTFEAWFSDLVTSDPLAFTDTRPYVERLEDAAARTGQTESVVAGVGVVGGHEVALLVGEFGFLAGTMGVASAERVVATFERAGNLGLPVLAAPVSGGTRMQEGTVAFVQMAKAAAAVQRYRGLGLPYLAWLRHPTTGGVLASWASLAHVTFAEPGALIGLTGPRVIELLEDQPIPPGVQTAEHLRDHGIVDDLCDVDALPARVATVLDVALGRVRDSGISAAPLTLADGADVDPWEAVTHSRRPDRPGLRDLLAVCARQTTPLRGDGAGSDDPGLVALLASLTGVPAVVVGHDRQPGSRGARLSHVGYRKARRAMRLAEEFQLPFVTVIDTEGARVDAESEERGLAREIAECLAAMSALTVPTLSLLLGEGAGGGAIALLPADRVVAAEHAWLAPIAPEGASAILHRTTAHARDLAAAQAITSGDLRRRGIVDVVVPDRPGPGEPAARFAERIAATAAAELRDLIHRHPRERRRARLSRYRVLGR